jgi:uncharacterized membrane protein
MRNSLTIRAGLRVALALVLLVAGVGHLTWARTAFQAQVPAWVPLGADAVVLASGVVELALGCALLGLRSRRPQVGLIVAAFFVAVFPGNVSQFVTHTDAFGLDSDTSRAVRLLFQPLLVWVAFWSTRSD